MVVLLAVLSGKFPKLLGPYPKLSVRYGSVPKDAVLQFVALTGVIEYQAFIVLGACDKGFLKALEGWEDAKEVLPEFDLVGDDVVSEDKDIVDVGAKVWGKVYGVLHAQEEEDAPVPTVHEYLAHVFVLWHLLVVHEVVDEEEDVALAGVGCLLDDLLLGLDDFFEGFALELAVNKEVWEVFSVESVAVLGAAHDDTVGDVSVMVHDIANEGTLTGASFTYEYASWGVSAEASIFHDGGIELVYF